MILFGLLFLVLVAAPFFAVGTANATRAW